MPVNEAPETPALETLRREFIRYRRRSLAIQCLGATLLLGAWTAQQRQDQVIRVRGIIVEDSLGRPRIMIGPRSTYPDAPPHNPAMASRYSRPPVRSRPHSARPHRPRWSMGPWSIAWAAARGS